MAAPAQAGEQISEQAVPVNGEASIPAAPVPVEPEPAGSTPAETAQPQDVPGSSGVAPSETVEPQDEPENGGVGLPAVDTPAPPSASSAMDEYLERNCEQGILRVQAFRGQQAIPVEGVAVTVRCPIDKEDVIFFEGYTDASGIIDPIMLPAPKTETSLAPDQNDPCSQYEIVAEHPEFETLTTLVMIFPGIKTIQPLQMHLKAV